MYPLHLGRVAGFGVGRGCGVLQALPRRAAGPFGFCSGHTPLVVLVLLLSTRHSCEVDRVVVCPGIVRWEVRQ